MQLCATIRRTRRGLLAAVAGVLLLAGCASGSTTDDAEAAGIDDAEPVSADIDEARDDSSEAPGAELDQLTIAISPILPTFNVFVAQEEGFFAAHGLEVDLQELFGSPLIAQAVQSGEVDLGTRNYDGIVSAIASGVDFQVVAPVVIYDDEHADAFVMLRSDLAEQGLQAIEGETFAVTLGSQQAEAVRQFLIDGGVDVDLVEFIEVGYGDMAAAFESGSLGGAHVVEPFITQLEDAGLAVSMGAHLGYVAERYLINAAFARGEWIADNPELVERFVAALSDASEFILADPDALLELASEWTGTPEDVLSRFYPERYVVSSTLPSAELQAPIDFNVAAGFHDPVSLDDVLADAFPMSD